jgi:hypothetical protein
MVFSFASNWLKERDNYGEPVSLRYKGHTHYQTVFGGTMSLVTYVIIFLFLYNLLKGLVLRESNVNRLTSSTNVVLSPNNYTMT